MNESNALLQAVLAAPEDDTPRLVYADWLEEHGDDARAEFIRVQIERARLREDDPRAAALQARENALLRAHRESWRRQELPAWAHSYCVYERGFAATAQLTGRAFLKAGGLFRRAPIRRVELRNRDGALAAAVAASPHLEKVSALAVRDSALTGAGWRNLLGALGLADVTELDLSSPALGPAEAHVLAAAPYRTRLRRLSLNACPIGDGGLAELAASPRLAALTTLQLLNIALTEEGTRALAASPHLTRLTALELIGNGLGPAAVRALADSPTVAGLVKLSLARNPIGDEGARALAESPRLTRLTELRLAACAIEAEGARALAASPSLANLTHLELDGNRIGDEGVLALAASRHLRRLTDLRLWGSGLSEEGARALAESPHLTSLRTVVLGHVEDAAMEERLRAILGPRYVLR
jgi:uncharacterized protein (TIGR02996 family)